MPEHNIQNRLRVAMQGIVAFSAALCVSAQCAVAAPAGAGQSAAARLPIIQDAVTPRGVRADGSVTLDILDNAVAYEEDGPLGRELKLPLYHWWKSDLVPRAVVVAVHGLVMHGRSFDVLGRTLAAQGFDVYALDMRGYGRSLAADHRYCTSENDCKQRIDYDRSYDDLRALTKALRNQYPHAPIFAVGESLGGAMVIRLAAKNPESVDGLILSAPAIKRHSFVDPYLVANAAFAAANPNAQLDLMPFVRKFCSDDPRVIAEKEVDPLLRRHLSAIELMRSSNAVRKTISFVPEIPQETPVLVIQGSADRCIKADAIMLLLANLRSNDQTVKWFHERGHILLETSFVKPDTMDAVVSWLRTHVDSGLVQAKLEHRFPSIAGTQPAIVGAAANATVVPGQPDMLLKANALEAIGLR